MQWTFALLIEKDAVTAKPSHVATGVFLKAPLGEDTPSFPGRQITAFFPLQNSGNVVPSASKVTFSYWSRCCW